MNSRLNYLFPLLSALLVSACGKQSVETVTKDSSTIEVPIAVTPAADTPAAQSSESLSCNGKYFDLAEFSNANWINGKTRKGAGFMFVGLTEEEFSKATSVYIDGEVQNRNIKLRKGTGRKYKLFVIAGEALGEFEARKVCINFLEKSE